jgi:hypothetical protein
LVNRWDVVAGSQSAPRRYGTAYETGAFANSHAS